MLIDPEDRDLVEAMLVVDQDALALNQDGVVDGVPCDCESR